MMITNKRKAQLLIISTFLLGVIVGASGQYLRQSLTSQVTSAPSQLEELTQTVRLTPDQRSKVDQILTETRQQYQEVRTQVRPQFTAVRDASRQRIRALLTPEQQTLYDQLNREEDAKREQKAKDDAAKSAK